MFIALTIIYKQIEHSSSRRTQSPAMDFLHFIAVNFFSSFLIFSCLGEGGLGEEMKRRKGFSFLIIWLFVF